MCASGLPMAAFDRAVGKVRLEPVTSRLHVRCCTTLIKMLLYCQGFVSVHCQEKCAVEFHRDCWTEQKSTVLDVRLDKVWTWTRMHTVLTASLLRNHFISVFCYSRLFLLYYYFIFLFVTVKLVVHRCPNGRAFQYLAIYCVPLSRDIFLPLSEIYCTCHDTDSSRTAAWLLPLPVYPPRTVFWTLSIIWTPPKLLSGAC